MQKITDTLYILKDEIVPYALISHDMSGGDYSLRMKISNTLVTTCKSSTIDSLIQTMRTIASQLSMCRLTDTLYIHSDYRVNFVNITNGYIKVGLHDEILDGWPDYLCPEEAGVIALQIAECKYENE
jgi:hypothetical protein